MSAQVSHPALGPCLECSSERVFGLQDQRDGAVVATKCETCGLILSMEELRARRASGTRAVVPPRTSAEHRRIVDGLGRCTVYGQNGATCTEPAGHPVPLPDGRNHHLVVAR